MLQKGCADLWCPQSPLTLSVKVNNGKKSKSKKMNKQKISNTFFKPAFTIYVSVSNSSQELT